MAVSRFGKPVPNPVAGYEVYGWPEFQALAKKLGIDYDAPTTDLTITFPLHSLVLIAHDYTGSDRHLKVEADQKDDSTAQERIDP